MVGLTAISGQFFASALARVHLARVWRSAPSSSYGVTRLRKRIDCIAFPLGMQARPHSGVEPLGARANALVISAAIGIARSLGMRVISVSGVTDVMYGVRKSWLASGIVFGLIASLAGAYLLGYVPDSWPSIKGIHLGMTEGELTAILPQRGRLTIGGVHDAAAVPDFRFVEGKLAEFRFRIPEGSYAPVRDAITAKYPQMRCRLMMVNVPGQLQMPHEECEWGSLLVVQSIFGQGIDPDRVVLTHTPKAETRGWIQDVNRKDV